MSNYEEFKEINDLLKKLDDLIKRTKKQKEKQKLIDYLKEQIKEQEHKKNTSDFGLDIVFTKGQIIAYEEILSKIEKE